MLHSLDPHAHKASHSFPARWKSWLTFALVLSTADAAPSKSHDERFAPADFRAAALHSRQQQPQLATYYGFFGSSFNDGSRQDGSLLAPLSEVFMAMTRNDAALKPSATGNPGFTTDSSRPSVTAPPNSGPGIVMTPTSPPQASPPSVTPSTPSIPVTGQTQLTGNNVIVLGCVIAGIIFFTVCLFFLMDPRVASAIFWKKRGRLSLNTDVLRVPSAPSWKTHRVPPPPFIEEPKINHERVISRQSEIGQASLEIPLYLPTSKFSISTVALSSCDSYASLSSAQSGQPPHKPPNTPIRPARPPTADSPALSDSVYLACSDQPYIIVAPQPLSDAEYDSDGTPQRILTPIEFAELYAKGKHSRGDSSPVSPPGLDSAASDDRHHSRTRSAPTPMFLSSRSKAPESSDDTDSDSQGVVKSRIMKHRRSRSASGWAYPTRPKARRRFIA